MLLHYERIFRLLLAGLNIYIHTIIFTMATTDGSIPFILVHIGDNFFPDYAVEAVEQIRTWNPTSDVFFICDQKYHKSFSSDATPHLHLIDINEIPHSDEHARFSSSTHLDTNFRDGFWRFTTERLFILYDFMKLRDIKGAIHIENDNTVYFSSTDPEFRHLLVSLRQGMECALLHSVFFSLRMLGF